MKLLLIVCCSFVLPCAFAHANDGGKSDLWVVYEGGEGPGNGKHVVLVSGDEEYRSEEALPQLGKILAKRHGFKCTVLFAINPETGEIDPDCVTNIPGLSALEQADLMIIATRSRNLPDEQMRYIDNFLSKGKPVIGMRTATHAFGHHKKAVLKGDFSHYDNSYTGDIKDWEGGFGRAVLGEKWISHHGRHKREGTRGLIAPNAKDHPIVSGISDGDIWGPTDTYTVRLPLPGDSQPLVLGQVQRDVQFDSKDRWFGMKPDDPPLAEGHKKNNPMMPVAWTKSYQCPKGSKGNAFNTTMGAATDLESEGLRRLLVNASYHLLGMKVPAKANVDVVGEFKPTAYGFRGFKKGVKPADHRLDDSEESPLGAKQPAANFFNGENLSGWSAADMSYWSVKDGAILGTAGEKPIKGNQFLWSEIPVKNFYLSLKVKQTPFAANAGIQFRSTQRGRSAFGYQADVGKGVWGNLYHEHGRKLLAYTRDAKEENIKQEEWNHYEILAVDHQIWLAINGNITVASHDTKGELEGHIALQIHGGPPQQVWYKEFSLIHDPQVALAGLTKEELKNLLEDAPAQGRKPSLPRPLQNAPATPKSNSAEKPQVSLPVGTHPLTNPLVLPTSPRALADREFALQPGETVVFLGGSDLALADDYGFLEALLTVAYAKQQPRFRNMTWEGDTVASQYRPRAFYERTSRYGQADMRQRTKADVIIIQLGKMESLRGASDLEKFQADYEKLVTRLQAYAPRVVLLTPAPFGPVGPPNSSETAARCAKQNEQLAIYVQAIHQVGKKRHCLVADVFSSMQSAESRAKFTNPDGVLTRLGQQQMATTVASSLGVALPKNIDDLQELRTAIVRKNQVWFEYWRPTNWAFLYGDRQRQPSSRSYRNRSIRWFPNEVEAVLPHLKEAEQEIFRVVESLEQQ